MQIMERMKWQNSGEWFVYDDDDAETTHLKPLIQWGICSPSSNFYLWRPLSFLTNQTIHIKAEKN